jgi:hypothetical protein
MGRKELGMAKEGWNRMRKLLDGKRVVRENGKVMLKPKKNGK